MFAIFGCEVSKICINKVACIILPYVCRFAFAFVSFALRLIEFALFVFFLLNLISHTQNRVNDNWIIRATVTSGVVLNLKE